MTSLVAYCLIPPPLPPPLLQARLELRELRGADEGRKLDDILGSVGLSGVADQLKDLRLGEKWQCVLLRAGGSVLVAAVAVK